MEIDETLKREIVDAIAGETVPGKRFWLRTYLEKNWDDIISSLLNGDWRKHGFRGSEVWEALLERGAVKVDPLTGRYIMAAEEASPLAKEEEIIAEICREWTSPPVYDIAVLDDWYVDSSVGDVTLPKPGARIIGKLRTGRVPTGVGFPFVEGTRINVLILSYDNDTSVRTPFQTFLLGSRKKQV